MWENGLCFRQTAGSRRAGQAPDPESRSVIVQVQMGTAPVVAAQSEPESGASPEAAFRGNPPGAAG